MTERGAGNGNEERREYRPATTLAIRQSRVAPVRFHAQELRLDEGVERHLTQRSLDAAEALELFECQSHVWHFQVFSVNAFQDLFMQRDTHGPDETSNTFVSCFYARVDEPMDGQSWCSLRRMAGQNSLSSLRENTIQS
jgi:hypothetical protein